MSAVPSWRPGVPVVDVHAHVLVPAAFGEAMSHPAFDAAQRVEAATFGAAASAVNRAQIGRIAPLLSDVALRLERMDGQGVDVQLVSPSPQHYLDWADEATSARLARAVNEGVAAHCALAPDRLVGLAVVPLHLPALAVTELEHAVGTLGLRGVEISTSAGGRELSDPALAPFWATAEALGALVHVHPWGCSLGARLDEHYLANLVGQPLETTLALSHLILSGTLDRYPGLKLLAAHGGGYLPAYAGRTDHAWAVRPDVHSCRERPSTYLRRLHYDTVVHDAAQLAALIARVGASQVLLGTDHPFDMGLDDPLALLDAVPGLTPADREAIAGGSAATLLGLPAGRPTSDPAALL